MSQKFRGWHPARPKLVGMDDSLEARSPSCVMIPNLAALRQTVWAWSIILKSPCKLAPPGMDVWPYHIETSSSSICVTTPNLVASCQNAWSYVSGP